MHSPDAIQKSSFILVFKSKNNKQTNHFRMSISLSKLSASEVLIIISEGSMKTNLQCFTYFAAFLSEFSLAFKLFSAAVRK